MTSKHAVGVDPALIERVIGPYQPDQPSLRARGATYEDMVGYVPPRIQARFHVTGALDPHLLDLQEQMRNHAMYPECLDQKTAQLMLFGMLLMDGNDAAQVHARAARRAGAGWDELQAAVSLCFLFRGLPAANRGADILAAVASREDAETRGDGA